MIELATWNSTIPVGTPAKVIDTPRLLDCYIDQYFRSGDSLFFWSPQIPPVGASLLAMAECQPGCAALIAGKPGSHRVRC
ncbi:hypothetical protein JFU49_26985 [Pseudomonas sp. TH03]|nr:hypothetical protein [Pseudomonas sp. TH03]